MKRTKEELANAAIIRRTDNRVLVVPHNGNLILPGGLKEAIPHVGTLVSKIMGWFPHIEMEPFQAQRPPLLIEEIVNMTIVRDEVYVFQLVNKDYRESSAKEHEWVGYGEKTNKMTPLMQEVMKRLVREDYLELC